MNIRIGTRRSDLARFQAKQVGEALQKLAPDAKITFTFVSSAGDRDRRSTLGGLNSVGVFTKESELTLCNNEADLIVHSLKDLPTVLMEGLTLAAVPLRHDPRDVLCGLPLEAVGPGTRIGTGSIRRRAQLLHLYPGIDIQPIRGNVPPRLRKAVNQEGIDGTILALAGLERLGLMEPQFAILPTDIFPYAVGQGALGIEARQGDTGLLELLARLEDADTRQCTDAERALMHQLEAGCSLPVGVCSSVVDGKLLLSAVVTRVDGTEQVASSLTGPADQAEELGKQLADELLRLGAKPLLEEATRWRVEG
ncbi:hydroxymethylbilane synthase [Chitinimonas arctica]|uniref:Hydroxymethylbilane synthase n=1 Tax=Chitinimonas arctica TaxID=2594795 RepID=A0A516SFS1_9NEIS|nr:hydroxymethylbilane synthase [Chitinimonas arctica]QDQ27016.1 hydroxymethylbilane synthase [Chitinimonas arctica]